MIKLLIFFSSFGLILVIFLIIISHFNPAEIFVQSEDEKRIQNVEKLARGLNSYYHKGASTIKEKNDWISVLFKEKMIDEIPKDTKGICSFPESTLDGSQNGYCYNIVSQDNFAVFTLLNSKSKRDKCSGLFEVPHYVYYSKTKKGCIKCERLADFIPGSTPESLCR